MRNAETILAVIRERGTKGLPLERVYRLLVNPDVYFRAYGRIARNRGAYDTWCNRRNRGRNRKCCTN